VTPTGGSQAERTLRLIPRDSAVDDARRFAELAVSYCSPECREAVSLAVCELGENVVKYGACGADAHAGTIGVGIDGDTIRIRATNRVTAADDAHKVAELISRISQRGTDVRDLYRNRLKELFSNPTLPRTQLGLLRMAFEGGFRLSCNVRGAELEITAERACDERK
jgi:hypothetical protein